MEVKASLRFYRIGPRKLRLVADAIRGKKLEAAYRVLKFSDKKGAVVLGKVLDSAVANADSSGKVDVDTLYIKQVTVDEGATMRRWKPRAMGRATPIRKRTSHLNIVLDER